MGRDPDILYADRLARVGPLMRRAFLLGVRDPDAARADLDAARRFIDEAEALIPQLARPGVSVGVIDSEVA